ncbi:MAG: HD domain-containing protein [Pseudomonadota bacterium]|nr:HD domain-containing protein [Pseudomonadota bacterium]
MVEVDATVARLARFVAELQAGTQAGEADELQRQGEQMARVVLSLLRMMRTHALNNQAFARPTMDLRQLLAQAAEVSGAVQITSVEGLVYMNDARVRFPENADVPRELTGEFARLGVGGLFFHEPLNTVQIRMLLECLGGPVDPNAPVETLNKRLRARGLGSVEPLRPLRFRLDTEERRARRPRSGVQVQQAATLIDKVVDNLGSNRLPDPVPVRRLITEIVSGGGGSEGLFDEYVAGISPFAGHVLRVSHNALMLGGELGLSPEALQDLGVCAMFHDLGYAAREGAARADGEEPAVDGFAPPYERHAGAGARLLMRNRGFSAGKVLRILATIEHHRNYDDPSGKPTLFGRIVRICEDYDNLVRSRGGRLSPATALRRMQPHSGTRYDPTLFQLLVNKLGAYPPGTLLELMDGRVVRASSTVRSRESFDRPVTSVVRLGGTAPAVEVDLAIEGRIARVLDAR